MIKESEKTVTMIQLKTALIGLKFEAKTGMKVSRYISAYAWVKNLFNYPPKSRPNKQMLIQQLESLIDDIEANENIGSDMQAI